MWFQKLTLALLLLVFNSSVIYAQITPKIIGGRPATSESWPWMAGLIYTDSEPLEGLFCGATLVAKNWLLTAAHCVFDENTRDYYAIINQALLTAKNIKKFTIDQLVVHPNFDSITLDNDIALLKLHIDSNVEPIQILSPYTQQDSSGLTSLALGWGTTSAITDIFPEYLQQVRLNLVDNTQCSRRMGEFIPEGMLCAGDDFSKKDTCLGDSGGPLIVFDEESKSWRQAGITSWGYGCAEQDYYGVYTRLKMYASFVSNTICTDGNIPTPVTLSVVTNNNTVTASWTSTKNAEGYRLNYAPYPQAQPIYSMDLNEITTISGQFSQNTAYYLAITAHNGNCISAFSNIDYFMID